MPAIGDGAGLVGQLEMAAFDEAVGDPHAERSGEMIVAGAGGAHRRVARAGDDRRGGVRPGMPCATAIMLSSIRATSAEARR